MKCQAGAWESVINCENSRNSHWEEMRETEKVIVFQRDRDRASPWGVGGGACDEEARDEDRQRISQTEGDGKQWMRKQKKERAKLLQSEMK